MDVSPFMTLLRRRDADVWLAEEEEEVCGDGPLDCRRFTPELSQGIQLVSLKLPEEPVELVCLFTYFLIGS